MTDCTCGGSGEAKKVLLYACSGGANVAEASDVACRHLMREGRGSMFCLAGIAAGIESMVEQAKSADLNLVIDGCGMDCARKIFEQAGLTNAQYLRATDLGLEKKPKGTRTVDAEVMTVVNGAKAALGAA
jgi:uncharacterized metal-binding protein